MRTERNNPRQRYDDFFNWLRYDGHAIWLLTGVFAYLYYLLTTYEV